MTEETASVFDTLLLCDDNYITLEHCDPDNWTADFTEFCEEFDKIILDDNMEQWDKWNALIFARIKSKQV